MSKPINLPTSSKVTVLGKDTTINNFFESEIKMIVYTDSAGCTSCGINRMYLWESFVEFAKPFEGKLKYYFIYAPTESDNKSIRISLRTSMFDYPIIVDTEHEFERLNPLLPKNKAMHAFLLDENNKVIFVGNPLHNKQIEKMFYEKVEKRVK